MSKFIKSSQVGSLIKDGSVILSHDESKFIVDRMEDTLNRRINSKPLFLELSIKFIYPCLLISKLWLLIHL